MWIRNDPPRVKAAVHPGVLLPLITMNACVSVPDQLGQGLLCLWSLVLCSLTIISYGKIKGDFLLTKFLMMWNFLENIMCKIRVAWLHNPCPHFPNNETFAATRVVFY